MNYAKRFIIAGFILAAILIVHFMGLRDYITLAQLKRYGTLLQELVGQYYWRAVLSYFLIFIGSTITGLPVTVVLTVAAGFLFGIFYGTLYVIISATSGAALMFVMVRYLIGEWVQMRYARKLHDFNQEIEQHGARYLLALQVLPITPTFLINLFAGISSLSLWTFIWATAVGIMPGTLVYTWAGKQLQTIESLQDVVSLSIIFILLMLVLLVLAPILWRASSYNQGS